MLAQLKQHFFLSSDGETSTAPDRTVQAPQLNNILVHTPSMDLSTAADRTGQLPFCST